MGSTITIIANLNPWIVFQINYLCLVTWNIQLNQKVDRNT